MAQGGIQAQRIATLGGGESAPMDAQGYLDRMYDYYQQNLYDSKGKFKKTAFGKTIKGMAPVYRLNTPGYLAAAQISNVLADPYDVSRSGLTGQLAGANRSYDALRQRVGSGALGSGAVSGGVSRGNMGNVELSRNYGIADAYRQYELQRQTMGDQRLSQLGLGWLDRYNQNMGIAAQPKQAKQGGSGWGDAFGAAANAAASYFSCWIAREVYGESDMRWLAARDWMLNDAPDDFREFYLENGERIAEEIKGDPQAKAEWRKAFDSVIGA